MYKHKKSVLLPEGRQDAFCYEAKAINRCLCIKKSELEYLDNLLHTFNFFEKGALDTRF